MFGLLAPVGVPGPAVQGWFPGRPGQTFRCRGGSRGPGCRYGSFLFGLGSREGLGEERLVRDPVRQQPLPEAFERVLACARRVPRPASGSGRDRRRSNAGRAGTSSPRSAPGRCRPRACAKARRVASTTATTSSPSICSAGMPYPAARAATEPPATWRSVGTEMAQPLFWTKNTTGAFITAAKFMASWTSPCEEAPSPKYVSATPSRDRRLPRRARERLAVCPADGVQHGAGHDRLDRGEPGLQRVVQTAVPGGLVGGHVGHHVHADGPGDAHLPVGGKNEVAGPVHGVAAAHLGRLLAEFGRVAGDNALPLPGDGRRVEVADGHHQRIKLAELVGGERPGGAAGCRGEECVHACDPSHATGTGQSAPGRVTILHNVAGQGRSGLGNMYPRASPTDWQLLPFCGPKTAPAASQLGASASQLG